ncbi:dihydrolipoyl dehydrogenase family protein [Bauldia sp.]|uniref:dihydrolipoyl dehydrogenase family protein n=1 Tax=Bauldia sp. TaxID=2575872 RepID=UPI003BAB2660
MVNKQFDVVVIGGGNAGIGVTGPARKAGLSVAVLEPSLLGGTCSNRGCTPKKVLVAAAHALDEIARAGEHKISVAKPELDWAGLIGREKGLIEGLPNRFRQALDDRDVTVIEGQGQFVGPNSVAVNGDVLEAQHIVVATGSAPRQLPIAGAELMVTSDEVLSDPRQPRHVVFIGGGVIAFEFAHVYARAGTRVTILEAAPHFLGPFDQDGVARVVAETERIGVELHKDIVVESIEANGQSRRVTFRSGSTTHRIDADLVVNGAGRVANLDSLDLEAAGVAMDRGRITTDNHFRSVSNPAVWAGGDALVGKPQLSPVATLEGNIIGENIAGGSRQRPDYRQIPSALYTIPTYAMVGLTEAAAREAELNTRVEVNDMSGWLSSRTFAESEAWAKVIVDTDTDLICGAHIVGHAGEELIHQFAMAMRHAITATEMKQATYAFPTYSADVRSMF